MAKILLFVLIALAIYLVAQAGRSRRRRDADAPKQAIGAEDIVACSRCGVHVPVSESVEVNGRRYCSAEHGRLG